MPIRVSYIFRSEKGFWYTGLMVSSLNTDRLTVAVIQMDSLQDLNQNLQKALDFCKQAVQKKAQFIVFPEVFNYRPNETSDQTHFETIPGPSTTPFMDFTNNHEVTILVSISEAIPDSPKAYNTSVLIGPKGQIIAQYRKIHLFDVRLAEREILESKRYAAGGQPVMGDVCGVPTGLSICYDLRFPELYRYYAKKGAKILCVPSNFTDQTGQAHWETLCRARAIENQCFVIAPNQVGHCARQVKAHGHSLIVDPWGVVLARGAHEEAELLVIDLDLESQETLKSQFPFLVHRKL